MKKSFKFSMSIEVDVEMTEEQFIQISNGIMSNASKFVEDEVFACMGMKPVYIGIRKNQKESVMINKMENMKMENMSDEEFQEHFAECVKNMADRGYFVFKEAMFLCDVYVIESLQDNINQYQSFDR